MGNDKLQSLANQIDWCRKSKKYLIELDESLHSLATDYQNNVESLKNQGYLADIFPIFEDMNREFQNTSSDLQGHINREHLAYIEKQSIGLSQDLKDILES